MWDIGGQSKIRPLWRYYFQGTNVLIWIIDSADVERIEESKAELHSLMKEPELQNAMVLIYANKSDLPGSMDCETICKKLELHSFSNRKLHPAMLCYHRPRPL